MKEDFEIMTIKEAFDEIACESIYEIVAWARKKTKLTLGKCEVKQ